MSLRRFAPLVVALGALACQPSVPPNTNPSYVDYAVFDPLAGAVPVPNDLALQAAASTPGAQGQLLRAFVAAGGFPNDQEVPITVGFVRQPAGNGATTAPDLDLGSVVPCPGASCNLMMMRVDGPAPQVVDPATVDISYTAGATGGTLEIRNKPAASGSRNWPAGARYVVALRGGPNGLKTKSGGTIAPQPTMYLLLQDVNLADPANQGLLPGTPAEQLAEGAQLEQLREAYALPQGGAPLSVFGLVDSQFPHREIADLATFAIAPLAGTYVVVDENAGVVPLPFDLLRDPTTGLVQDNPAFGPLAGGIATLDGFSTSGMIMAPTSGPVAAATVAPANPANQGVFLYELAATGPKLVYDLAGGLAASQAPTYLAEPPPITEDVSATPPVACTPPYGATCFSQLVGLQPAVPVPTPVGTVALPPLKEDTEYAVVITNRVLDAAGKGLVRSTVAQILLLDYPLAVNGKSQLSGVDDATAQGLEAMRLAVVPAVAALPSPLAKADVAMAYTFRTETITEPALLLGAAPYDPSLAAAGFPDSPVAATVLTPAAAGMKYGVDPTKVPLGSVSSFVDATIVTYDKLDPQSGAFYATASQGVPTAIPALIAIPAGTAPAGGWPLAVFHHGLGGGRAHMLLIAGALANGGIAVAAIDAAKHGDRSWCTSDADCATGATCNHAVFGNQGDPAAALPGLCTAPGLAYAPVDPTIAACSPTVTTDCWNGTGGVAKASGSFLISGNFFRWRDTVRQDVLDQSNLVRVLTTAHGETALAAALGATGPVLDPTRIYYVGQSLGSIEGTIDLAANPRFSRAVLNVGGATWVDIGVSSPTFQPLLGQLLAQAGITPGTAGYLQFLYVAKWVLDPADPVNFAGHLVTAPLPDLLVDPTGATPQAAKAILGQAALCDDVVPNSTNQELYGNIGLSPLDPATAATTPGLQWYMVTSAAQCPADGVTHGFLLDGVNLSITTKAQTNATGFLVGAPTASTPVVQ